MRRFLLSTSSVLALAVASTAHPGAARADVEITYNAIWSGTAYDTYINNLYYSGADIDTYNAGASATGTALIDITTQTILSASVTVSGAFYPSDDGTYTLSDFTGSVVNFDGGLPNYHTQLVGQTTGNSDTWGVPYEGTGDFNFYATFGGAAPASEGPFILGTDGGEGYDMLLTSLIPATTVPEPASAAVLAVGLAGLVRLRRRARGKAKG